MSDHEIGVQLAKEIIAAFPGQQFPTMEVDCFSAFVASRPNQLEIVRLTLERWLLPFIDGYLTAYYSNERGYAKTFSSN